MGLSQIGRFVSRKIESESLKEMLREIHLIFFGGGMGEEGRDEIRCIRNKTD